MDKVYTFDELRKQALLALKAADGILEEPTLILFTNSPSEENPAYAVGSLTEPTFTGYAAVTALAFGTPYKDDDGKWRMNAPSHDFIRTGGVVDDTIRGWAIVKADKTKLYALHVFPESVLLDAVGEGLTVIPSVTYPD